MVSLWSYATLSASIAIGVLLYAYQHSYQFYPTVVQLWQSKFANLVLVNLAIVLVFLGAKLLKTIFLGPLRDDEMQNLQERLWGTIMETLLSMTIFHNEFNARFFVHFGILLGMKIFHWIAHDRVDYFARSLSQGITTHLRMSIFLFALLTVDGLFLRHSGQLAWYGKPSMMIMFAFEYMILFISMSSLLLKYGCNCLDQYMDGRWESKNIFFLYLEFMVDIAQVIVYVVFFLTMMHHFGLPIHLLRVMWFTFRSFSRRFATVYKYHLATRDLDRRFPLATEEQLEGADVCIVCREEMTDARVMPCGHIMHSRCLLRWLERSQSCPICRQEFLGDGEPDNRQQLDRQAQQAAQQQQQRLDALLQPQPRPQQPEQAAAPIVPFTPPAPPAGVPPAPYQPFPPPTTPPPVSPYYMPQTPGSVGTTPYPDYALHFQQMQMQQYMTMMQMQMAAMREHVDLVNALIQSQTPQQPPRAPGPEPSTPVSDPQSTNQQVYAPSPIPSSPYIPPSVRSELRRSPETDSSNNSTDNSSSLRSPSPPKAVPKFSFPLPGSGTKIVQADSTSAPASSNGTTSFPSSAPATSPSASGPEASKEVSPSVQSATPSGPSSSPATLSWRHTTVAPEEDPVDILDSLSSSAPGSVQTIPRSFSSPEQPPSTPPQSPPPSETQSPTLVSTPTPSEEEEEDPETVRRRRILRFSSPQ